MSEIGKIIVQEKHYELAWNGGVRVKSKGALPDDEVELCLKMLEERLAGVSSYVGDANVAE